MLAPETVVQTDHHGAPLTAEPSFYVAASARARAWRR
jgi:hypothetical protein